MKNKIRAIGLASVLAMTAPVAQAQFQSCVYCDVMAFNPDPFPVDACETGTIVVRGDGFRNRSENNCSATPEVTVRSTRPDRLSILAFRVMNDGSIEVDYRVPCDATMGLVGIDVKIDDDGNDVIEPYACGNARMEVVSVALSVRFDAHGATRTREGVAIDWKTVDENGTLAFEIWAKDAAGDVTRLDDMVFAEGRDATYSYLDGRDVARRGDTVAYQLVEWTWDGAAGDATPWFEVSEPMSRKGGARLRGGNRR